MINLTKNLSSILLVAMILLAAFESVSAETTPTQAQQENRVSKRHGSNCTRRKLRRNRIRTRMQRRNNRVRNRQTQPSVEKPATQPVIEPQKQ